ncbi:MAG TPA: hypothetical protein VM841_12025 [Actinomycetota bacterium]|nr:hypothetical protein [Actinomycetota bacterium]
MKKIFAAAVVAAGLFASLPASADVIDIAGTIYVDDSDATVWQESNGVEGLQREADGETPADSQLL